MNHPPPTAFGLTITPVKGPASINSAQQVTVWNLGTHSLDVTMSAREIIRTAGKCHVAPHDATWARVTPEHFILKPGTHRPATLIIDTTSPGQHDLVAWATTPTGTAQVGRTTVQTNAALGSQFLVRVPGIPTSTQAPCVSLAPQHSMSDFPVLPTALAAIATLALLLAVWAVLLRKRRRAA